MPIDWQSHLGSNVLGDPRLEFDVPWRDLMNRKPVTLTIQYKGLDPEDTGTWTVSIIPVKQKQGDARFAGSGKGSAAAAVAVWQDALWLTS